MVFLETCVGTSRVGRVCQFQASFISRHCVRLLLLLVMSCVVVGVEARRSLCVLACGICLGVSWFAELAIC